MNKIILINQTKVLIIEDTEILIMLYKEYFKRTKKSIKVNYIQYAEEAIKHIETIGNKYYDYIFVDYILKGDMTGGQFIRRTRNLLSGVIYGTSAEDHYNELMLESGADDIINKDDIDNLFDELFK